MENELIYKDCLNAVFNCDNKILSFKLFEQEFKIDTSDNDQNYKKRIITDKNNVRWSVYFDIEDDDNKNIELVLYPVQSNSNYVFKNAKTCKVSFLGNKNKYFYGDKKVFRGNLIIRDSKDVCDYEIITGNLIIRNGVEIKTKILKKVMGRVFIDTHSDFTATNLQYIEKGLIIENGSTANFPNLLQIYNGLLLKEYSILTANYLLNVYGEIITKEYSILNANILNKNLQNILRVEN